MIRIDEKEAKRVDNLLLILAIAIALVVAASVAFGFCVTGCTARDASLEASRYAAELAACEASVSTCPGYLACRQRVAASHGRTYQGRCVALDGGAR